MIIKLPQEFLGRILSIPPILISTSCVTVPPILTQLSAHTNHLLSRVLKTLHVQVQHISLYSVETQSNYSYIWKNVKLKCEKLEESDWSNSDIEPGQKNSSMTKSFTFFRRMLTNSLEECLWRVFSWKILFV